MTNPYIIKLSKDKVRITQQILNTKQQLTSLQKTLEKLDEQINSYAHNKVEYTQLNGIFSGLTPFSIDYYDEHGEHKYNFVKHLYTQIGFSDIITEKEKQQISEYVTIFKMTNFPAFIGHNLFTEAEKKIIHNYKLTINQYVEPLSY